MISLTGILPASAQLQMIHCQTKLTTDEIAKIPSAMLRNNYDGIDTVAIIGDYARVNYRGGQNTMFATLKYQNRFEILRPQVCSCCGQREFSNEPIKIETQQVAQLVDRPIEIVEYQRYTCICSECGETQTADWSPEIVPGQDIGVRLQAFLGWINNYGHLPYEKRVYSGDSDLAVAVTRLCYSAPAVGQCNRYIALPSSDHVTQRYFQHFV